MVRYIIQRIIGMLFIVVGIVVGTFVLSHSVRVDPVVATLGEKATPEQIALYRTKYCLDLPLWDHFTCYIGTLLRGDLGFSLTSNRPVFDSLLQHLPATVELTIATLIITVVIGLPLGIIAAHSYGTPLDWCIRWFAIIGGGMPVFLLGFLLQALFSSYLGWLPRLGRIDNALPLLPHITGIYTLDSLLIGDMQALISSLHHLLLPACTLGWFSSATLIRMTRLSMHNVLTQNHIQAAYARGIGAVWVVCNHALRNAIHPILTMLSLSVGYLVAGSVLTEMVFSWPGIGWYLTQSAKTNDLPVVVSISLIVAIVYTTCHMVAEILQRYVDPRIVYG